MKEFIKACDVCGGTKFLTVEEYSEVMKCCNCEFIFHNPRPKIEEIINFYSNAGKYDDWLENLIGRDKMWKKRLKIFHNVKKYGSLLDVGSGIGQCLNICKKYYTVSGTEISKEAVKLANEKYNIELIEGTLSDVQLYEHFDIVTMFHVLEHVPSPTREIILCSNLLKKNGLLVLAVPNAFITPIIYYLKCFLGKLGYKKFKTSSMFRKINFDDNFFEIHLSYFTPKTIRTLLKRHRFTIVKMTVDPYFPSTGVKRIIDNLFYITSLLVFKIIKINLYRTIFVIAKKDS